MAIKVDLFDDGDRPIIAWTFDGRWDWTHLAAAHQVTRKLAGSSKHVDIVYDVSQMGLVPKDIVSGMRKLRNIEQTFRGDGINVVIGADYYLKLLWQFAEPQLPASWAVEFADDLDVALQLIQAARGSTAAVNYSAEYAQAGGD